MIAARAAGVTGGCHAPLLYEKRSLLRILNPETHDTMKKITSVPCHTCTRREYHLSAEWAHVSCEAYREGIPADIVTGEMECPHRKDANTF